MPVAYRSSTKQDDNIASKTIVGAAPAGIVDEDFLLAIAGCNDGNNVWQAEPGWNLLHAEGFSGLGVSIGAWWRTALSESGPYTFDLLNTNSRKVLVIAAYSGAHPTSPLDVHAQEKQSASDPDIPCPDVTTIADNALIVRYCHGTVNGAETYSAAGMIEREEINIVSAIALYDEAALATPPGPQGVESITCSGAWRGFRETLAIAPFPTSGGGGSMGGPETMRERVERTIPRHLSGRMRRAACMCPFGKCICV